MPTQNFYRDVELADILAEIRKEQQANKAGKTSGEARTQNTVIQFVNSVNVSNSFTNTEKGIIFKITNDAGGGVTSGQEGKISQALITDGNWCVIAAETANGYSAGIHVPGIIGTGEIHANN
jgi:hypothetical protein